MPDFDQNNLMPVEIIDSAESAEEPMLEMVDANNEPDVIIEISVPDFDKIPGAPEGAEDPVEEVIEVVEDKEEDKEEDENDARKGKPAGKWDWKSKGAEGFLEWIKERFANIPKHSGYDSAGLERACSYLDKLDAEISKAMRLDIDGELDANKIEEVRSKIDDGLSRLQDRLNKVKKSKKSTKKKADIEVYDEEIKKEAQKSASIVVTVPLFISTLARILINGTVSAGHDTKDMYNKLCKKYDLKPRERLELMQLMRDMGFPLRGDRGLWDDEELDQTSSDNFDFAANYPA